MKYKIGDRVRITNIDVVDETMKPFFSWTLNQKGLIVDIDTGLYHPYIVRVPKFNRHTYCNDNELIRIKHQQLMLFEL